MKWRLIVTDTESLSGVAPVCPTDDAESANQVGDCCPLPHLECWTEDHAKEVLDMLNGYEVQVCE